MQTSDSLEKTLMLGKIEGEGEGDEMVRLHHRIDGYEFEQVPGFGDGVHHARESWYAAVNGVTKNQT